MVTQFSNAINLVMPMVTQSITSHTLHNVLRNQKEVCLTPYKAPLKFGLIFPFIFILLLVLLLAIILWVDWR